MIKYYTVSGRKIIEVVDSITNTLVGYYQVNKEVMENNEKIEILENIVDLIKIKESIFKN